jgi:hypothetical protein
MSEWFKMGGFEEKNRGKKEQLRGYMKHESSFIAQESCNFFVCRRHEDTEC